MDLQDFLELAKQYQDLGWAVQEQLDTYLVDPESEDLNPNAVELIEAFLKKAEEWGAE